MTPDEASELRRQVRLKRVLQRGTALASAYSRPEVQERSVRAYDALLAREPQREPARDRYLETIADSYRVLRTATGYAAQELWTTEELAEEFAGSMRSTAPDGQALPAEVFEPVRASCAALAPFVADQQRILDQLVAVAEQRGLIGMSTDPGLPDRVTRTTFPSAGLYRRQVFGLFDGRLDVAEGIARALEDHQPQWRDASAHMRDQISGDAIALREALRFDTEARIERVYPADERDAGRA